MPRRISDYPDAFAGWNLISSFGSIVSVIAAWLFLYIVYAQLVEGKSASRYPWMTPQYYTDTLQALLNRSYPSLEWALSSPPKPHAFVSLPLQSNLKFIFILLLLLLLIIIITFIIGGLGTELLNNLDIELLNNLGSELLNNPGSELLNNPDSEIYYSGTLPGKRCPTCLEAGREIWVIRGRCCYICDTYVC